MELADGKQEEEGDMWCSLPELPLWMIKDKLDIFGNFGLASVCHDWRSASVCYPKRRLYRVGDGMPWIWHCNGNFGSSSREVISIFRSSKLTMHRPEFAKTSLMSSKQGWLLLRMKKRHICRQNRGVCFFFVNLFTRDRIELPDLPSTEVMLSGVSFTTTSDGFPHRVFLLIKECRTTVTIKSACPGDETWTCQTYTGLLPKSSGGSIISIGNDVYYLEDASSQVTVFNVANHSYKELPILAPGGFIAEHDGQLLYIERKRTNEHREESLGCDHYYVDYDCSSFAVYRYNDDATDPASVWERLDNNVIMGTSWFLSSIHPGCFTAKGNDGLKVYYLRQMQDYSNHRRMSRISRSYVVVNDLVTGTAEILPLPFPVQTWLQWVAIG